MGSFSLDHAQACKTWAFEEAKSILKKIGNKTPDKGYVLFETGYGPSGLPHIGTFGEVCRTSMVRAAFRALSDIPTRLFSFSDDMDGLRKVPDNLPNKEMLQAHLGMPLTSIPDPFGKFESMAHHNNARLREFLDSFGFDYEFLSSTTCYKEGRFNAALLKMLENHEAIIQAVLPILGEERKATYSPFLPLSPKTGRVLQVPMKEYRPQSGTVVFEDEDGSLAEVPVTDGHVKMQWRPDWALRYFALDVDYEMAGKDLVSSNEIAKKIVRILGGTPPAGFHYELFLDEKGEKISKSKGNGLSMEEWLRYAPQESLALYMFQRPASAKKLHFDIIPKAVDEYLTFADKLPQQEGKDILDNPAWYIHGGNIDQAQKSPVSFALLLNLASAANALSEDVMWGFIKRYKPDCTAQNSPFLAHMISYAVRYYEDFVLPQKTYRKADEREHQALENLLVRLRALPKTADAETIQTEVFSAGKENGYPKEELRAWFQAIYEICIGQTQGPRFGSFAEVYGLDNTIALVEQALNGQFLKKAAA
jgi:lysyl-tRNA synthetase, class I